MFNRTPAVLPGGSAGPARSSSIVPTPDVFALLKATGRSADLSMVGSFIVLAGFAGLVIGTIAAVKGSLPSLRLSTRKQAAGLIAAGLLVAFVGAGIAAPAQVPEPAQTQAPSPSPEKTAEKAPDIPAPSPSDKVPPDPPPSPSPAPSLPAGVPPDAQGATVSKNVDGDTIWVKVTQPGGLLAAGAVHKIRILEIDTPESTMRTDCFGVQASEFAKRELAVGSAVYLAADKQDKDRYGRFLRYVWKAGGDFYNERAVVEGFAKVVLYPPNDRYITQLRAAEGRARAAATGLWSSCAAPPPAAAKVAPPAVVAPPPAAAPAAPGCHGSYQGACLPAGAEDVDCAGGSGNGPVYTDAKDFRVVGPDVYGLDANKDGVACESA